MTPSKLTTFVMDHSSFMTTLSGGGYEFEPGLIKLGVRSTSDLSHT